MQARPYIARGDRNLLFEFKAVKKSSYLKRCAFDSVYAQVWCYTMDVVWASFAFMISTFL